jgi:hypothetical protein
MRCGRSIGRLDASPEEGLMKIGSAGPQCKDSHCSSCGSHLGLKQAEEAAHWTANARLT